ncbi:MAG: cation transporter [Desulfitobacterium sp.]|nr:cation transporter [Desulfitobacterium sp.]
MKLLSKIFIPNFQDTQDKKVREGYGVLAGIIGIICNLLLFALKLILGLFMNSIAVISDAFNNLTDCGSSIIAIIAAKMSNRPPDPEHPYGHGRIEYISSLIVAIIILLVGFELLKNSFGKILNPEEIVFNSLSIILLLFAVAVKLWMYSYNRYIGNLIDSGVQKATAFDSLSDAIATSAVIVSTLVGYYFNLKIDGYVGLLISLFILYAGYSVAKETISVLLGASPNEELAERIVELVNEGEYIVGTHDLKVHDYGPGRTIASIHAEILDTVDFVKGHLIIDNLEKRITEELNINIVIHLDPICTDQEKNVVMEKLVQDTVSEVNNDFSAHNIRMTKGYDCNNVIFQVIVPPDHLTQGEEYRIEIIKKLKDKDPKLNVIIDNITAPAQVR